MAILRPQSEAFQRDQVSRLISWGHWFTFFNILLALVISGRYILANPWPETQLGVAYLILSWLGHFSFVGFIAYLLTLFPSQLCDTQSKADEKLFGCDRSCHLDCIVA